MKRKTGILSYILCKSESVNNPSGGAQRAIAEGIFIVE